MPHKRAVCVLVAAGLAVLSLGACADQNPTDDFDFPSDGRSDTSSEDLDTATADAGDTARDDTNPDPEDAGDVGDTGDVRGEVDVIRRVVEREFFGELPVENYVLDPMFRGVTTWLPLEVENGQPTDYAEGHREVYPETPLSAPVFRVPSAGAATNVRVLGQVALRQQPLEVSIWVGREGQFDDSVQIQVIGVTADDPSSFSRTSLTAESGTETEMGDLRWKKFSTEITGFFGQGYLIVEGSLGSSLYLHGPTAVAAPSGPGQLSQFTTPELHPATSLDRASLRVVREWTRRHRPDPRDVRIGPTVQYFTPGLPQ